MSQPRPAASELERRTIARVSARLVPFLIGCYFVAYLDRVNVGFAALTMNHDLQLSASAFGFGAGIFFIAYFFFEVPSNLQRSRRPAWSERSSCFCSLTIRPWSIRLWTKPDQGTCLRGESLGNPLTLPSDRPSFVSRG